MGEESNMKVALVSSCSVRTPWSGITLPNRLEYCLRHNYTMAWTCESYQEALNCWARVLTLLECYDLVWTIDADCLITDMTKRIDELPELGPHASICEQGLGAHILVNGGSIVWRASEGSRSLLREIIDRQSEWVGLEYNLQQWFMQHHERLADRLTICHKRAFNSCDWGGTSIWQPGDFVYHPCGAPERQRMQMLNDHLKSVVR
jgi:hypothetical protein